MKPAPKIGDICQRVFASVPCPVCHWASEINGSWIPTACFSVVLRQTNGRWDALAVIMPNEKVVAGPVSRFLTTISSIQRATTLDILAGMDEATKTRIERERAAVLWSR